MGIVSIFKGAVVIATAIPKIKSLIDEFIALWVDKKVDDIKKNYSLKENKIAVLNKMLKDAETNEQIIVLSIVLHDLNNPEK